MTTLAEKWAEFCECCDLDASATEQPDIDLKYAFMCGASAALVCVKESACAAGTIATTNMALGPVKAELERLEKSWEAGIDDEAEEV